MSRASVGISGFRYPEWRRGAFYPVGLRQRDELRYCAERFDTIEVNGSFWSLLRPSTWQRFADETPAGFPLAVKGGRFITHMKRLRDVQVPLANFFASGVLLLGDRLGPVLWQLPATQRFDDRIEPFLASLPRTHAEISALAHEHDHRVEGRAILDARVDARVFHAIEPRHPSFFHPRFFAICRALDVAVVVADSAGRFPVFDEQVASFVYVRLHGDEVLYYSDYSAATLQSWARRTRAWLADGRDVWIYFDNDVLAHAPRNALTLRAQLDDPAGDDGA